MKRLQPVIWMKGTFLSPQYLQTQDRFIESSLQFQLQALSYSGYGVHKLVVNQEALSAGYVAISEASGILPDGLLFDIPDADQAPPPKPQPGDSTPTANPEGADSRNLIVSRYANGHRVTGRGEAVTAPLLDFYRRATDRMLMVRGKISLGDVYGGVEVQ